MQLRSINAPVKKRVLLQVEGVQRGREYGFRKDRMPETYDWSQLVYAVNTLIFWD